MTSLVWFSLFPHVESMSCVLVRVVAVSMLSLMSGVEVKSHLGGGISSVSD